MSKVRSQDEMVAYKRDIIAFLKKNPDCTAKEVQTSLFPSEDPATVAWHLKVMSKQGILVRNKGDDNLYKYVVGTGALLKLRESYGLWTPQKSAVKTKNVSKKSNSAVKVEKVSHLSENVEVFTPTVKLNLQGEMWEVPLTTAKSLYFKLHNIFKDE